MVDVVDDVVDVIDNVGITIDSSDVRGSRPSNFLEKLPLKASSLLLKTFWIICWSVLEIFHCGGRTGAAIDQPFT